MELFFYCLFYVVIGATAIYNIMLLIRLFKGKVSLNEVLSSATIFTGIAMIICGLIIQYYEITPWGTLFLCAGLGTKSYNKS